MRGIRHSPASDRNQAFYDQVLPGQQDYWRLMAASRSRVQTILALIGRRPAATLVDLGCGGGQLLAEVRRHYPRLATTGVDLSVRQVEENRRIDSSSRWVVANLDEPVDFAEDLVMAFDTVVAMEVIEHVENPRTFLENALNLVKPGGRLLLSTQSGPMSESEQRVGHVRHFEPQDIEAHIVASGWHPEAVWNTGFPFHDLSKWLANRRPDWAMKSFGEQRYGWFQKAVCYTLRGLFWFNSKRRGAQLFAVARRPEA